LTLFSLFLHDAVLALWRDADPELPEVEDARKRLVKMKKSAFSRARTASFPVIRGSFII